MSETWFTADLHLGHANIIKYSARPHLSEAEKVRSKDEARGGWNVSPETVARHDSALINAINERVALDDVLWILGDFSLGTFEEAKAYRDRIACREVNFVRGNHDAPSYDGLFSKVIDQGMIKVQGKKIWLNHYPMRSWDKAFHGAWHLYGHVHGRLQAEDAKNKSHLVRDVGVDACDYVPISFAEMQKYMAPREEVFWEWKGKVGK
jgi:calcineurin-like phosphoesterase family protein